MTGTQEKTGGKKKKKKKLKPETNGKAQLDSKGKPGGLLSLPDGLRLNPTLDPAAWKAAALACPEGSRPSPKAAILRSSIS